MMHSLKPTLLFLLGTSILYQTDVNFANDNVLSTCPCGSLTHPSYPTLSSQLLKYTGSSSEKTSMESYCHQSVTPGVSYVVLNTRDRYEWYQFYPISNNQITFKVQAKSDALIALTSTPYASPLSYEILLGGWVNNKSVIRMNIEKPIMVREAKTPMILNKDEYRSFWIRWNDGTLAVGKRGDTKPFLHYDNVLFPIQYFSVCTNWSATGSWIINPFGDEQVPSSGAIPNRETCTRRWLPSAHGDKPPDAFEAGRDFRGELVYVARSQQMGGVMPGKLVPSMKMAYVSWNMTEYQKDHYEVLNLKGCAPRWVVTSRDKVPLGALISGISEDGKPLYVCRARYNLSTVPGKAQPNLGSCFISLNGEVEVLNVKFEILVLK